MSFHGLLEIARYSLILMLVHGQHAPEPVHDLQETRPGHVLVEHDVLEVSASVEVRGQAEEEEDSVEVVVVVTEEDEVAEEDVEVVMLEVGDVEAAAVDVEVTEIISLTLAVDLIILDHNHRCQVILGKKKD